MVYIVCSVGKFESLGDSCRVGFSEGDGLDMCGGKREAVGVVLVLISVPPTYLFWWDTFRCNSEPFNRVKEGLVDGLTGMAVVGV